MALLNRFPWLMLYLSVLAIAPSASASDCNNNNTDDSFELAASSALDCNANSYPDECDIIPFPQFVRQSFVATSNVGGSAQATGDFDQDGSIDILGLSSSGALHFQFGPTFTTSVSTDATGFVGVLARDLDHDDTPEILAWTATDVAFFKLVPVMGQTAPSVVQEQIISGGSMSAVVVGDINGDNTEDLIIGQSNARAVRTSLFSAGVFSAPSTTTISANTGLTSVIDLFPVDLDGNGVDDILALLSPSTVVAYSFSAAISFNPITYNGTGRRVFADDFDNDTDPDIFFVSDQEIVSSRNIGSFVYSDVASQIVSDPGANVLFADFDNDGLLDFTLGPRVGIFKGKSNGSFDVTPAFSSAPGNAKGVTADFNGDGRLDLAFADTGPLLNKAGSWSQDADANDLPDECQSGLLVSPLYSPWNGFLNMTNILEVVNSGMASSSITVTLLSAAAAELSQVQFTLAPGQQFDVIANALPGFAANSYGTLRIAFTGSVEGRMSYYRPKAGTSEFEFVTTLPLSQPLKGNTAVTFNTFDPQSSGPKNERRRVDEYLSLINLSPTKNLRFKVARYQLQGNLILVRDVVVLPPFARYDVEAGHEYPGANYVGSNIILPDDPDVPYLAFSNRYGVTTDTSGNFLRYRYVNTVVAQTGTQNTAKIPFVRGTETNSIAEIVNQSDTSLARFLQIFRGDGSLLQQFPVVIPAYGQLHLQAIDYLPADEKGSLQVLALPSILLGVTSRGPVVQSVNFVSDPKSSSELVSAYTIPLRSYFEGNPVGSYNRYLGMTDTLRVTSTSAETQSVSLEVYFNGSQTAVVPFSLAAHQTTEIELFDGLGTAPDTYGSVRLTPSGTSPGVIADVIRKRPLSKGRTDYHAISPVR